MLNSYPIKVIRADASSMTRALSGGGAPLSWCSKRVGDALVQTWPDVFGLDVRSWSM